MKLHKLALALALLTALPMRAQTRIITGVNGSIELGNQSVGAVLGLEQPISHRFEADLYDTASPIETHLGLGSGTANQLNAGGILWINHLIGLSTQIENSSYNVTSTSKSAYYLQPGVVFHSNLLGVPSRFTVLYSQQIDNGIQANGDESSHLRGTSTTWDTQLGCSPHVCIRTQEKVVIAHGLEQGNPLSNVPRKGFISGGFSFSLLLTFSGKNSHEF